VVTEYSDDQLELVLEALERMNAHLTAAVVSNDPLFLQASSFICVERVDIYIHLLAWLLGKAPFPVPNQSDEVVIS
jgi:hypothetical protein